jgi:dienelactone hydrolase
MRVNLRSKWGLLFACTAWSWAALAEPIFYEKHYPATATATAPAPAIIALHSSGGYASIVAKIAQFTASGYAVYTPDFFKKYGLTSRNRFETWTVYRTDIERELTEIVQLMKEDPRIDPKNIFAVGYSNGGYWAAYLAAKGIVNAGVSHYGVWDFPGNADGYPSRYFSESSNPVLALIGTADTTQKFVRVSPQVGKTRGLSPTFKTHLYDAGHAWDCAPCRGDYVFNAAATSDAATRTLDFFKVNSKN